MPWWRIAASFAGVTVCAVACVLLWPRAEEAAALLGAQDDPARLSDVQLHALVTTDPGLLARETEAALQAGDVDLAASFVAVAADRSTDLPDGLLARVAEAKAREESAGQVATRFATGLVTGEADDAASLSGAVAGDLFVFGDIRDVLREGKRMAMGEDGDRLILGLAATGLAVTAASYLSAGGATPVRAGLTLVKDARKAGRLGEGLSRWARHSLRAAVDGPALQQALATTSLARPGRLASALKAAVRTEKVAALVGVAKNIGRVGKRAGTRGALDALKLADGPKDIARAARLAEAKGGQTRAILKVLGRGALVLAFGAFDLALYLLAALVSLLGFVVSIKTATERVTQRWLHRRKAAQACLTSAQAVAA